MRQTSGPLSPTCLSRTTQLPLRPTARTILRVRVGVSTPDLHLPITSQQALHSSPSDRLELRAYRLQPQWPIENPSENPEPVQLSAAAWQSSNRTKDQPASVELTIRCCVHSEEEPGVGTGKGSDCKVWPQGDCHRDEGPRERPHCCSRSRGPWSLMALRGLCLLTAVSWDSHACAPILSSPQSPDMEGSKQVVCLPQNNSTPHF